MCDHFLSAVSFILPFHVLFNIAEKRSLNTTFHRPPCKHGSSGWVLSMGSTIVGDQTRRQEKKKKPFFPLFQVLVALLAVTAARGECSLLGSSQTMWSSGYGSRECFVIPINIGLRQSDSSSNSDRSYCSVRGNVSSTLPAVVVAAVAPKSVAGAQQPWG